MLDDWTKFTMLDEYEQEVCKKLRRKQQQHQTYLALKQKKGCGTGRGNFKTIECLETKQTWKGLKKLATVLGINAKTIAYHVRNNSPFRGLHFRYIEEY